MARVIPRRHFAAPSRCRRFPSRTTRRSPDRWCSRVTASLSPNRRTSGTNAKPAPASVTGPVVVAGCCLVVPESQNFGYDSYAGLDVKDKIVLVLHYFPEDTDAKTKATLARYSDLRYKALAARQRGAKGLLIVIGPRSPNAGQTL